MKENEETGRVISHDTGMTPVKEEMGGARGKERKEGWRNVHNYMQF